MSTNSASVVGIVKIRAREIGTQGRKMVEAVGELV
jgi:hypothetical protein